MKSTRGAVIRQAYHSTRWADSARPVGRLRRAPPEVITHVGAETAGLAPVERRAHDRPREQRPERYGAAPGPGQEPALEPPAQRRAHRQGQPARCEANAP